MNKTLSIIWRQVRRATCQKEKVEQNEVAAGAAVPERLGADTCWCTAAISTQRAPTNGTERRQTGDTAPARRDWRRRRRPHAPTPHPQAGPLAHRRVRCSDVIVSRDWQLL